MKIFGKTLRIQLVAASALATASAGVSAAVKRAADEGNPIGAAALAAAQAAEATSQPGSSKKVAVIAAITPLIVAEAAKGSLAAVEADVEQFAGLVVEEVVARMKATPLGLLAAALLAAFGLG